ncbi:menaquinone-dependent protoporphyrinogen IX dehydrogenase [Formosa sp. S-31]|uniref:menaquinone-dependent protoporphyrinogen IX dehydrogenase n=1 Tax=Formosa sp. S-31 TaxID=2790949 RepID=UPI003EC0F613
MDKKAAILYSTVDGQTLKICKHIVAYLNEQGFQPELRELKSFKGNVSDYNTIILGASIRYGKHQKNVIQFIETHQKKLEQVNTAFFSVNLVARNPEKNSKDTNPYLIKFFKTISWRPDIVDVFAGRLDYASYTWYDRLLIKLIMKITHGPTQAKEPLEYTNWSRVDQFSETIIKTFFI